MDMFDSIPNAADSERHTTGDQKSLTECQTLGQRNPLQETTPAILKLHATAKLKSICAHTTTSQHICRTGLVHDDIASEPKPCHQEI
jgi:hypothetical protein